jgi:hypothetical protein
MPAFMNLRTTYARFHVLETLEICSLVITPKKYSEILTKAEGLNRDKANREIGIKNGEEKASDH